MEKEIYVCTSVNEQRCQECPPERMCAWACEQGMNQAEIFIGTALNLLPYEAETDAFQNAFDRRYNGLF